MKLKFITVSTFLSFLSASSIAQDSYQLVYDIYQAKCVSCHNSSQGILDLSGTPDVVYSAIINQSPKNTVANGKGDKIIDPGYVHRSYLLRKINNGLDTDNGLVGGEGAKMPLYPNQPLTDIEIETIRQWVLFGAPKTGNVVDTSVINTFYNEGGIVSLKQPLAPPPANEGFQIHIGKILVGKGQEVEWYLKYDPKLPSDIEINRINFVTGTQSHHFVIYKYYPGQSKNWPNGLRDTSLTSHGGADIVAPFLHYQTDTKLPNGTAYHWFQDDVIDFDFHIVNYSQDSVMAIDAYVNIYTQPVGTAQKIMFSRFFPKLDLVIPQDGQEHTFTGHAFDTNATNMWNIWTLYTHTHKYGLDYDIYKRNPDGTKGEQIYEGFFDYDKGFDVGYYQTGVESPQRKFEPLLEIDPREGIIHEAVFKNYAGPDPVYFGLTSQDEMMVAGFQYTIGDTLSALSVSSFDPLTKVSIYPNPFRTTATVEVRSEKFSSKSAAFIVYDLFGREVSKTTLQQSSLNRFVFEREKLAAGSYLYKVVDSENKTYNIGKLIIQ